MTIFQACLACMLSRAFAIQRTPAPENLPEKLLGVVEGNEFHWDQYAELDDWAISPDTKMCKDGVHFFTTEDCGIFQSHHKCKAARKGRTFLASYPCSGNTWARVMLDQLTGVYTGSVFNDNELIKVGLNGEGHRDEDVFLVKTHHPVLTTTYTAEKAVVLMRSPLDAALSFVTYKMAKHSDAKYPHAAEMPHKKLRQQFDEDRDSKLEDWKDFTKYWFGLDGHNSYNGEKLIVRFEELAANTTAVLQDSVLPFLGISAANVADRMHCAVTANIPGTHREHTYTFSFTDADQSAVKNIIGSHVLKAAGYD